jgi:hypothetical protein
LRRLQVREEERVDLARTGEVAAPAKNAYPRWAVISGLVIYCAVFWGIIATIGSWGVDLVRTAVAGPN